MPSTSMSAVYGSPTTWYLRMSPSKGEASNSLAVRPRAESVALKASSVGAKAVTLAEVSSKAFSKPAALIAAARVERFWLPYAASTSLVVVTPGLMQSGLPWLKLEAPSVSVALAAAGISSAVALAAGISSAVALSTAGIAGISSAVALPTAGIDQVGISSAVALSTASSRRFLPAREGIAEASTKAARSAVAMRFFLAIIIGREG